MSEYLTELREGASACLNNANRLLEDSKLLFDKKSYQSCFLLSQLALEELAKGFKLIEKHQKSKQFSREEWNKLTRKGSKAHKNKLKYLKEVEDKWTAEITRELGKDLNYFQVLKKTVAKIPWAKNVDKYRDEIIKVAFHWRLKGVYVDYDWKRKRWFDPSKDPIFNGIFIDHIICFASILRANNLLGVLSAKLQEKK